MKLRDPKDKVAQLGSGFSLDQTLKSLGEQARSAEQGKWHSYKIEVITPIFGGGVKAGEPDTQMPIRASAIRGQLRYWWRFLASVNRDLTDPEEQKRLFQDERKIWGGMAEEGKDYSSKVKIRIKLLSKVPPLKPYVNQPPQYALFPARKTQDDKKEKELIWIDSSNKLTFKLQFCAPEKKLLEVERVLRWWVTFGGIGARTRRGCGSVYCTNELEKLPPVTREEAEAVGCELVSPEGYIPGDPIPAWKQAVKYLYEFRQGEKTGRDGRFGISRWPEAHAIRRTTKKAKAHYPPPDAPILFPRAIFGMPLAFSFLSKNDKGIPPETELLPMKDDKVYGRLTSPLILRPMATPDGNFKPAALLMPYSHLFDLKLHLQYQNKNSAKPGEKSEWTFEPDEWCDRTQTELVDPIQDNNGTDALTAFMDFFARGGR